MTDIKRKSKGEAIPVIKKTYDYSMFKFLPENRPVDKYKVARLKKSIQEDDETPWRPILANGKMGIVDGQNQFTAQKELGLPIYYVVNPDAKLRTIALLNAFTTNWNKDNFLEFYVKQGYDNYIQCKEFAKKWHLSTTLAMYALTMTFHSMGQLTSGFKEGSFTITHKEEAETLMEEVTKLKPHIIEPTLRSREFYRAYMLLRNQVEFEQFKEVLEHYNLKIEYKGTKKEYLREFEDILNYKKQTKVTRLF